MNRHFFFSVGVVLILAARGFAAVDSIPEATPETFFGDPENLELVKAATSITVFRIIDEKRSSTKPVKIGGYPCDASAAVMSGPEVAQVIASLTDMTNFGGMFVCDFNPGVILRFASGKRTLDLIVCFHCHEMMLCSDGAVVRRAYQWASTKNSFRKDARRAFTDIAKRAFPNDAEIQALKD